ncbi:LysE family translocator [Microbispora sp. NPDC049125]|uniref:LysE family translocator n=1 Tax=Microbispora sp. NPDC049125 TaxID=3154929 RepID=UPI0034679B64
MSERLLVFAGATILLAISPGPASALVIRQTLHGGRRIAFMSILGVATGLLAWLASAVLGLSALIAASPGMFDAVRVAGAALLVLIGLRTLLRARTRRDRDPGTHTPPPRPLGAYAVGLLTCLTNPKVAVFALALLPQFVSAGEWSWGRAAAYALVWAASSSLWYTLLSLLLSKVRWVFERSAVRRRLEQVTGVVLLCLGVRLVVN